MKKILFLFFVTIICLSFTACFNNNATKTTVTTAQTETNSSSTTDTEASATVATASETESTDITTKNYTSNTAKKTTNKKTSAKSKPAAPVARSTTSTAKKSSKTSKRSSTTSKKSTTSATKATENTTTATVKPKSNKISITIGSKTFTATLYDNQTAVEFKKLLPLTLNMIELNGNEKYYYLDSTLPTDTEKIKTIHKGDIMLYGNDCIVLFYDTFDTSYSYTKIGRINNSDGMEKAAGKGNIKVKFYTE